MLIRIGLLSPLKKRSFCGHGTCMQSAESPIRAGSLGNADDLLPFIYPFLLFCFVVRPLSFSRSFQGSTDFQTADCSMPFLVISSFRSLDTFWLHHRCQTVDPLPNLLPQVSQHLTTIRACLRQLFPLSLMHHSQSSP